MKVLVVVGTRPEAIKMAPVIAALSGQARTIVCATGQHGELLAQALEVFGIVPDFALDAMRAGQSLNALAARLLQGVDGVLAEAAPDWVLVQGDTTSAFCGALAAFHRDIAVGHVEAGLRTGDLKSPFPEEANRQMLSRLATHHFAPTDAARQHLLAEQIAPKAITVTGNTVVDAIDLQRRRWAPGEPDGDTRPLVLVTCHRRENLGDRLAGIASALAELAAAYPGHRFVFPLHPNPAQRGPIAERLAGWGNFELIEPLRYDANLQLLSRAALVITDSGGLQEEAPSFGVPVVVMRTETERPEGVAAGFATLAGLSPATIVAAARAWLEYPERARALAARPNPYGDGRAAERIVATLLERLA